MASVYETVSNAIMGEIPEVGIFQAQDFVNQGWKRIQLARDNWSFNTRRTRFVVRAAVTAGAATVTQDSATVTLDATADAAVAAEHAILSVVGAVFRVGTGSQYIISAYSTPTLTLEETYSEADGAAQTYQITRGYLTAPTNLRNWNSIIDRVNVREVIYWATRQELDQLDISRTAGDTPGYIFPRDYVINTTTSPPEMASRWEWWPEPTTRCALEAVYQINPWALSETGATAAFPAHVPDALLRWAGLCEGFRWAEGNRKRFEALAGADWRFLLGAAEKRYAEQLHKAEQTDENIFLTNWGTNYLRPRGAFGSSFLQSHDPYGVTR